MGKKVEQGLPETARRPPARDPLEREKQMVSLAEQLAEKQLMDGTASSQTINHYLKLGSTREALEQAKIEREVAVLESKKEQLDSQKKTEDAINDLMERMRRYGGFGDEDDD